MSIKVCNRCVLDTTVPDLVFDKNRECNYCKIHDALEEQYPLGSYGRRILLDEIRIVKEKGKSKKYIWS